MTVLIVDDNTFMRRALRNFAESANMQVCGEAADGKTGISQAVALRPDLIIMDFAMPGMNGLEASHAIKRAMPQSRIVMFTLHADKAHAVVAKASGVDLVVAKEEGTAALRVAIRTLFPDSSH